MEIDDETVRAYSGARELCALYEAYRASSRAHLIVLERIGDSVERNATMAVNRRQETLLQVVRRAALARQTDAVFAVRAQQLRERMRDLLGLPGAS
jgi:hypothetical protein